MRRRILTFDVTRILKWDVGRALNSDVISWTPLLVIVASVSAFVLTGRRRG